MKTGERETENGQRQIRSSNPSAFLLFRSPFSPVDSTHHVRLRD